VSGQEFKGEYLERCIALESWKTIAGARFAALFMGRMLNICVAASLDKKAGI